MTLVLLIYLWGIPCAVPAASFLIAYLELLSDDPPQMRVLLGMVCVLAWPVSVPFAVGLCLGLRRKGARRA